MPSSTTPMTADFFKAIKLDEIDNSFQQELLDNCGIDLNTCLECGKCSGGCSNTHIFDITARQVVKLIKMGEVDSLLKMDSLWTCVSCQLCVDRCPASIDIPRIMDYLREVAYKNQIPATREQVLVFHELMLGHIEKGGRVEEGFLAMEFNLKTGDYFKDVFDPGMKMFFKGKVNPFTPKMKKRDETRRIFKMTSLRKG
ncbi:MAG: heterodisulfide reductase subunit C [Syntrophomonadaceae bacterium]|nr:heterodisulfide reductase subunit C [Syntrophomonadaceae bacterium]